MALPEKPIIGKNVLETLTSGMYENPLFIFREYIQNSADQIDVAVEAEILDSKLDGKIEVLVDPEMHVITVTDNATGVPSANVRKFLSDVANSEKEPSKRKGFRGIGRLGGLGYCKRLTFETSYQGEAEKNTMTLNAVLLRDLIANREDDSDAAAVISLITTIETTKAQKDAHYFKVTLYDVENPDLLDEEKVQQYLSIVAPVPFAKDFKFKKQIEKHFAKKNILLDEYQVVLNGSPISKAYKNFLADTDEDKWAEITSVGFFDVRDDQSQLLGVGWYGVSTRVNEMIPKLNVERGIRIRKNNITIGDETTLYKRFKADRTNLRYIGEIHVIGSGFIPNARRDYFNDNRTKEQFEKSLQSIFKDFENKLPHRASDLHNRLKDIKNFRQLLASYLKEKSKFSTSEERDQRLDEVQKASLAARKASARVVAIKKESEQDPVLKDLFNSIVADEKYEIDDKELDGLIKKDIFPPLKFAKLTKPQEQILNEVVIFLQKEMGHKQADPLIRKLQAKYN